MSQSVKTKIFISIIFGLAFVTIIFISYSFLKKPNIGSKPLDAGCLIISDYSDTGKNPEVDKARSKIEIEEYERCIEAKKSK